VEELASTPRRWSGLVAVYLLTLQESLREPAVEAGIVLLLELIAIIAYAVHL